MKKEFSILFIIASVLIFSNTTPPDSPGDLPVFFDVFIAGKENAMGENNEIYAQFREQNVVVTNSGKIVVVVQGA